VTHHSTLPLVRAAIPALEERRRGAVDRPVAAPCHFMQRAQQQAAARERLVDVRHAKGQHRPIRENTALKVLNALSEFRESGIGGDRTHARALSRTLPTASSS